MANLNINKLSDLMVKEFEKQRWLIEELVPQDGLIMLSASPNSYKTFLSLEIAHCVAKDKELNDKTKIPKDKMFLGRFKTEKTGVLICDEENGERLLQERFTNLGIVDENLPIYYSSRKYSKMTKEYQAEIVKLCKENDIGLIIFDALIRFLPSGTEENVSTQMAEVLEFFKRIADNEIACICLHHNKKRGKQDDYTSSGDAMRGSSEILAVCDVHISLDRERNSNKITISQTKNRYCREMRPIVVELKKGKKDSCYFQYIGDKKTKADWDLSLKLNLWQYIKDNPGLNKNQVADNYPVGEEKIGRSKITGLINNMLQDGELRSERGSHNSLMLYIEDYLKKSDVDEDFDGRS